MSHLRAGPRALAPLTAGISFVLGAPAGAATGYNLTARYRQGG